MVAQPEILAAEAPPEPESKPEPRSKKPPRRDKDLLAGKRDSSPIRKHLEKLFDRIAKGFQDQADRSDTQQTLWDCWNCCLNSEQFYNGNAEIYVPIIRDALEARATRFVNQLFPSSGRFVEAVSADGHQPNDIIALLDHYIRVRRLKTQIARPLSIAGDIEGQYNLYVDWGEVRRQIVSREKRGIQLLVAGEPVEDESEKIDDIKVEDILDGSPVVEVLHDSDVLVLPAAADSVAEALEADGCVVIVRRLSAEKIERLRDAGLMPEVDMEYLKTVREGGKDEGQPLGMEDVEKKLAQAIGVRAKSGTMILECWSHLPLGEDGGFQKDGDKRLCRTWFALDRSPLGCARNPNWNDLCPLLSAPVKKVAGVFKGQSLIEPIAPLQYEANDAANEGADSAHYSAMPIVIKDSARAPAPIILNLGAVINAPPDAVHLLDFPDLLPRAAMRIQQATQAIFQALSVNPAMLPQQTGRQGAKRNQAEVALEQQVDILTTAEAVTVLEQDIFTPLMGWFVDLDYQHRDRPLTVRAFGTMGIQAQMEEVEPLQNRHRYEFRWWGVEQAKNAAQLQQQISGINVLKGMKQDIEQEGYRVRLWPLIESMAMSMFGPRQGALVIEDARHQSTLPPDVENQLLAENYEVPVQPMDQDIEHIQAHQQAAQQTGDPFGTFRVHLGLHMKQLQQKQEAQAMQAMQQAMQQQQQGGQAGGPGRPGPRPGAQPAPPRPPINAPGAIRPDAMPAAGAVPMPRRM